MPWRRGPCEGSDQIPGRKKTCVPVKLITCRLLWPWQKKGCRRSGANAKVSVSLGGK